MQRTTQVERYKFTELLQEHVGQMRHSSDSGKHLKYYPYQVDQFAKKLLRYGATLGRIAENQCNGYKDWQRNWDEEAAKRDEIKEERIQTKVTDLCAEFGCKPIFSGDPRGATLKIQVPDGFTNDWGQEGICVPTS